MTEISISLKLISTLLLCGPEGKEGRHFKYFIQVYSTVFLEAYSANESKNGLIVLQSNKLKIAVFSAFG